MRRFSVIDAADQQFGTVLNNQRVTIRLRYNVYIDRWSFDLSIDDLPVLHGRRVVIGVDLLKPFNFGIGMLFALPTAAGDEVTRDNLIGGIVNFYHATEDEISAAIS